MKEQEFQNLIQKDKYQIFVFASKAHLPFFFALHPWFVVNNKGVITRYEIVYKKNCCPEKSFGHLHLNALPPYSGIGIFSFSKKHFWKSELLWHLVGDEGSTAHKMQRVIESSKDTYPYVQTYDLTGPNSNTYIQWVLDQFPESNFKLPLTCFGKGFKMVQ